VTFEDHLQELHRLFAEAPVTRFVGQELRVCRDGTAEVALPFREELLQGLGVVHGGFVTFVADTAGWFAVASLGHARLATAQLGLNFTAPVRSEELLATARVLSAGKRLAVCELRVTTRSGTLVGAGQATYAILVRGRSEPPPGAGEFESAQADTADRAEEILGETGFGEPKSG